MGACPTIRIRVLGSFCNIHLAVGALRTTIARLPLLMFGLHLPRAFERIGSIASVPARLARCWVLLSARPGFRLGLGLILLSQHRTALLRAAWLRQRIHQCMQRGRDLLVVRIAERRFPRSLQ